MINSWRVVFESFRIRGKLVHAWGRLKGTAPGPDSMTLEITAPSGAVTEIPAAIDMHQSPESGLVPFTIYGACSPAPRDCSYRLILNWDDGRSNRIELSSPKSVVNHSFFGRVTLVPWKHYFMRGSALLRAGQWRILASKLRRITHVALNAGSSPRAILNWLGAQARSTVLIIDHDLGGGAGAFRENLLKEIEHEGHAVLLVTAQVGLLTYEIEARLGSQMRKAYFQDVEDLFSALSELTIEATYFNNCISFPNTVQFVAQLSEWVSRGGSRRFIFLLHDYYAVCPVWTLIHSDGSYCGVPSPNVCDDCLGRNRAPFLSLVSEVNIREWRSSWGKTLALANEIRSFSESSKKILLRAYPDLPSDLVTVVPHTLNHVELRKVRINDPGYPVIGVIGTISHPKGAAVVRRLAQYLAERRVHRMKLVIVGTIEGALPVGMANVTGRYDPKFLPELLERTGVNVALFPSIWPETFSYVTSELIEMGLPVIALDMGAPGERVGGYEKGILLHEFTPELIVEASKQLYRQHVYHAKAHPGVTH